MVDAHSTTLGPAYEAPPWIIAVCKRVTLEYRRGFAALRSRVEGTSHEPQSSWDARIMNFTEQSPESIFTTVCLTGRSNLFLQAWERHCRGLTHDQLAELHRHGQRIAEAPEIRFTRSKIIFPGIWRFVLGSYFEKLTAAGVTSI